MNVIKKPLRVSIDCTAGPYLKLPVGQLNDARRLLNRHRISYGVAPCTISNDGGPEMIVVKLGHGAEPEANDDDQT